MKAFYLLKPDMLDKEYFFKQYLAMIENSPFLKSEGIYNVGNWVELSKRLYDVYENEYRGIPNDEWRKKMLITIMGYYKYYKDEDALVDVIEVDESNLERMDNLKREYRKLYVYNREKYFISIENEDKINYNKNIIDINLDNIKADYFEMLEANNIISVDGYKLILFNKIHFPDPTVKDIERDQEIIEKYALSKKKVLKVR